MKTLRKWIGRGLLVGLVLIIAATLALVFGWPAEPFPSGSMAQAWLAPGPYRVEKFSTVLTDASRQTAANGKFAGSPTRTFDTDVFFPVDANGNLPDGEQPVVLYLHGLASWKEGGAHFSRYLAGHGFIVLAADFPMTNFFAPGGPNAQDVINQPSDTSFFIDSLLAWHSDTNSPLHGHVDSSKIALLGYSLGGLTATLATFHPQLRDPRVAATISMAGPSSMFGPAFFEHSKTPFLMLAGDLDAIVDYPLNAGDLPQRAPAAQLVTLARGSHIGFMATAPFLRWLPNTDAAGCVVIRRVLAGASDAEMAQWLESLGTPEMGIIHNTSLPCQATSFAPALNPLRQHMLAKVVIRSFLQSRLATAASDRISADDFLARQLSLDAADVTWQTGALPNAVDKHP